MCDYLPTIFIGSSVEGERIAREIERQLQRVSMTTLWTNGVFQLGDNTLESLMRELDESDFAIMILSPDDLLESRKVNYASPRDNVIFELGLFMGRLGRYRTFIVHESDVNIKLPSDLAGITIAPYRKRDNLAAALSPTCTSILNAIDRHGKLNNLNVEINCPMFLNDEKRLPIIKKFCPDLYIPLEKNLLNTANNPACDINVFPHVNVWYDKTIKPDFTPNYGYKFDGSNMISVQMKDYFPYGKQARTFVFAVNPTDLPTINKPMFFFAYGARKSHNCGDGITNHDKSFGVFWGEPKPKSPIPEKYKGVGVRVFLYCEHCEKDRTSNNCDTKVICDIKLLNTWYVYAVSYDGSEIKFYQNGKLLFCQQYNIETSQTLYLNIGGFVHHDESGAVIARDLNYSMNGYIREFTMLRKTISEEKIMELSNIIRNIVES